MPTFSHLVHIIQNVMHIQWTLVKANTVKI